jgi:acetyl-CoA carboxylase biotin carboxyl carrier protein
MPWTGTALATGRPPRRTPAVAAPAPAVAAPAPEAEAEAAAAPAASAPEAEAAAAPAASAPEAAAAHAPAPEAAAHAPAAHAPAPEAAPAPAPEAANGVCGPLTPSIGVRGPHTPASDAGGGEGEVGGVGEAGGEETGGEETGGEEAGLVAVRAPLPGTFYRAPRPGAAPFAKVGSRVGADTVIGIVETMKLMNPVHAGVAGVVAEFCVGNAEFAAHGAPLLRIRADR